MQGEAEWKSRKVKECKLKGRLENFARRDWKGVEKKEKCRETQSGRAESQERAGGWRRLRRVNGREGKGRRRNAETQSKGERRWEGGEG